MKSIVVSGADPLRLDQFLAQNKIAPTRSQISRWIAEGHVRVNGKAAKASYRVRSGDVVEVEPPPVVASTMEPEAIPLSILYEDADLIVINKQVPMVVHPGAGHASGTLTHALLYHCGSLSQIGGVMRPGIVHRLDKGTSGVMVIAKNDAAHLHLSRQFKDHSVQKIYWAIVYGKLKKKEGTLETLIARSDAHRKKFTVHATRGKRAVTHYRVLKEGEGLSWVELRIETGRTHQIRVHLTHLGHSIAGDPLYGAHKSRAKQVKAGALRGRLEALDHPLLHARQLALEHPTCAKRMEFKAEPPDDFQSIAGFL